jgi:NADH dehydrogenase FAD-containing subunit
MDTRIFAVGDVAKTSGPRMVRAARSQADIATANILSMSTSRSRLNSTAPRYT